MSIFSIPSSYDNFYDNARLKITWRLNLILVIFLPPLAFTLYKLGVPAAIPTLIGFLVCLVMYFVIKKTESYKLAAIVHSLTGAALCLQTLIAFPESYHFVDVVWMLIIILHTYFTLGTRWGMGVLLACLAGTIYYLLFVLKHNLSLVGELPDEQIYALAVNFSVCTLIIGYYVNQFLKVNAIAENKFKEANEELKSKNEEKTLLLREIHHRVKNNLQVITSLLRLQAEDFSEGKQKESYTETINRVVAMSMIHDRIFESPDLTKIDFEVYVDELLNEIVYTNVVATKIDLNVTSEIEHISAKSLVPVALIFNELITNSIKHAFKGKPDGEIKVEIQRKGEMVSIYYQDNGTWQAPQKTSSLGLDLIRSLTSQLNGQMELIVEDAYTAYRFDFESGLQEQ